MPIVTSVFAGALIAGTPVNLGPISPEIHKTCLEARDYSGCVQSQLGKAAGPGVDPKNVTVNEGAALAAGNSCPAGYAYTGGGYCKRVKCEYNASGFNALGHDQLVAGKSKWGCKYSIWYGAGVMRLEDGALRATNNPDCPPGEPKLGWNNTCETAPVPTTQPTELPK